MGEQKQRLEAFWVTDPRALSQRQRTRKRQRRRKRPRGNVMGNQRDEPSPPEGLPEDLPPPEKVGLLRSASEKGHLSILKWMQDDEVVHANGPAVIEAAARYGHLEL